MNSALGRPFQTMWMSYAASNLGDGLNLVAYPLLAVSLTDDARLVAAVSVFRFLPFLVIGLPAGVILDRFGRRNVVMAAQGARALALLIPPLALLVDRPLISLLALSGFVVGVGEVFTDGGIPAVVRDVVRSEQLEIANARLSATETTANAIVGPTAGAAMFALGSAVPFLASAVLYLGAGAALIRLPLKPATGRVDDEAGAGFRLGDITAGLRYVWAHPVIRPLALAVALFSFVNAGTATVLVLLATEELGLSSFGFGVLLTVSAVFSVSMSLVVARLIARWGHANSMRFSVATFVISALLYGVAPGAPVAAAASAFDGVSAPAWNVVSGTVRQRLVPDHIFGRMMTAYLFVAWSMQPVGALVAGVIAERWGADRVFLAAAVIVASMLVVAQPLFRRIQTSMATPDPAAT